MSYVQFENRNESRGVPGVSRTPGMVLWLQKNGVIKNEKTAHYILIGVIVICFSLAGFMLAKESGYFNKQTESSETGLNGRGPSSL